jgi:peptidoglycan hydrolase-like protein with peptidoglycan-binding domain
MSNILKKGSSGDEVRALQSNLKKLGFAIESDGIFGDKTYNSIITLQTIFGYDVDGLAGPATQKLVETQAGYGWNLEAARKAFQKAQS